MLEVIALAKDPPSEVAAAEWAQACTRDLHAADPDNILESSYVTLGSGDDPDYRKIYGDQYDRLVELKSKYDPKNVFKYAVPKVVPK
jgi:hypothetical protein